ncbi:MAG: PEP-CTERM sorting domain-containing protein, partial [Pirellulales bacterium]|nr:PEP-CTERM sorting domain-containing protein [Pirellulales bacterium]
VVTSRVLLAPPRGFWTLITHGSVFGEQASTVTVSGVGATWNNRGGTLSGGIYSSVLCVGYYGSGTLNITDGGAVTNGYYSGCGYIGYASGSTGTVTVSDTGSTWHNSESLYIGRSGEGTLSITAGGEVTSVFSSYIGYNSGSTGTATVDGTGSTWNNNSTIGKLYVGYSGNGTLHISGGGSVSAASASINEQSIFSIDVGYSSLLDVGGRSGTITNNGVVRILAGAGVAPNNVYSPISATTWSGSGVYQAVGGTWDEVEHEFTASAVVSSDESEQFSIFLNTNQRALIADDGAGGTGWSLGASFLHKTGVDTELLVTATAVDGDSLADLQALIGSNETVLGAWEMELSGEGYAEDDPVYLSFAVGEGYKRGDLLVWHCDEGVWSSFDAMDLTVNDGWASFTATEFSGYAVSTVPEPGTLILLLAAGLGLLVFRRVGRGRMNYGGAAQTNQP